MQCIKCKTWFLSFPIDKKAIKIDKKKIICCEQKLCECDQTRQQNLFYNDNNELYCEKCEKVIYRKLIPTTQSFLKVMNLIINIYINRYKNRYEFHLDWGFLKTLSKEANELYKSYIVEFPQLHPDLFNEKGELKKGLTKGRAKEIFKLKEKVFTENKISYKEYKNPYYRTAYPMKLYDINELLELWKKFAMTPKEVQKLEQRREKRRQTIQNKKDQREYILTQELKKYNLQLRSDSVLCNEYIERNEGDLNFIVYTMREMNWFKNPPPNIKEGFDYDTILNENIQSEIEYKGRFDIHEQSWVSKIEVVRNNLDIVPQFIKEHYQRVL